jgi:hypothetical protein
MGGPMDTTYVALIGDLVGSRTLDDRAGAQERVEAALTAANDRWASELAAGFAVTLGDEYQGMLTRPDHAFEVIATLESVLGGVRARYGIGLGTLATPLRPEAIGMDGPCFHRAREAVERGKREDRWITVSGFGTGRDQLLNGVLRLMGGVRREWTDVQAETVFAAREADEQKAVARSRGVSEATVSKALKAALYDSFVEAEGVVAALLAGAIDAPRRGAGEEC